MTHIEFKEPETTEELIKQNDEMKKFIKDLILAPKLYVAPPTQPTKVTKTVVFTLNAIARAANKFLKTQGDEHGTGNTTPATGEARTETKGLTGRFKGFILGQFKTGT